MKIFWTINAVQHLKHIRTYIGERNPEAASRVGNLIQKAVDELADFPSIGRPGRVPNTRELKIPSLPFILCYTVEENCLMILAVMHASRKWPDSF